MNLADQIHAKRAQIGQMESQITSCKRGLNHFSIGEDRTVFIRYSSIQGWQSGTIMLNHNLAKNTINTQLDLLKVEIDKAEQELQILINSEARFTFIASASTEIFPFSISATMA